MEKISINVDLNKKEDILKIIDSCLGTKFSTRWGSLISSLALDATLTSMVEKDGKKDIDIKRFVKVEKIPGGEIEESKSVNGVILNKDVLHAKMRRRIENPRILLLDCSIEYQKAESHLTMEIEKEEDWTKLLKEEEEFIENMCNDIIKFKPDLVITEKGLSDLAQHFLVRNNISALRRLKKSDNDRLARLCGATIVNRVEDIQETDLGTCSLFEVHKIGDEYFSFITKSEGASTSTILLRGASKDILNEVERNLQDALNVAKNVIIYPRLVPGGGATEMSISQALLEKSKSVEGVQQWPYRAISLAFEVIPRTLAQNCGSKSVRVITELRAKHAVSPIENSSWGINGETGVIAEMKQLGILDSFAVKAQAIKTSIEAACLLLRVDEIVSGISKKGGPGGGGGGGGPQEIPRDLD
jgi:T-complex protein 1 subunit gamma